jgi:hypothetical protein
MIRSKPRSMVPESAVFDLSPPEVSVNEWIMDIDGSNDLQTEIEKKTWQFISGSSPGIQNFRPLHEDVEVCINLRGWLLALEYFGADVRRPRIQKSHIGTLKTLDRNLERFIIQKASLVWIPNLNCYKASKVCRPQTL